MRTSTCPALVSSSEEVIEECGRGTWQSSDIFATREVRGKEIKSQRLQKDQEGDFRQEKPKILPCLLPLWHVKDLKMLLNFIRVLEKGQKGLRPVHSPPDHFCMSPVLSVQLWGPWGTF